MVDMCRNFSGYELVPNWQEIIQTAFGGAVEKLRDHWRSAKTQTVIVVFKRGQGLRPRFVQAKMVARVMNAVIAEPETEEFYMAEDFEFKAKQLEYISEVLGGGFKYFKEYSAGLRGTVADLSWDDWLEVGQDYCEFLGFSRDEFMAIAEPLNEVSILSSAWKNTLNKLIQEMIALYEKGEDESDRHKFLDAVTTIMQWVENTIKIIAWYDALEACHTSFKEQVEIYEKTGGMFGSFNKKKENNS